MRRATILTICLMALVGPLLCLALTGCTTPTGQTVYQKVEVPVAVTCVPDNLPRDLPKVRTPEQFRAISGPDRYVQMAADYLALFARSTQTEPVVAACRKVTTP